MWQASWDFVYHFNLVFWCRHLRLGQLTGRNCCSGSMSVRTHQLACRQSWAFRQFCHWSHVVNCKPVKPIIESDCGRESASQVSRQYPTAANSSGRAWRSHTLAHIPLLLLAGISSFPWEPIQQSGSYIYFSKSTRLSHSAFATDSGLSWHPTLVLRDPDQEAGKGNVPQRLIPLSAGERPWHT